MLLTPAQTTRMGVRPSSTSRGHVERRFRAAVHAADAARREDLDAREVRRHGRAGDRRRADERAVVGAPARDVREVPAAALDRGAPVAGDGDALELGVAQAHAQFPVEHGDRRRHGAARAHARLDGARHLEVPRIGHAVGDDRRLEGDDGAAPVQRGAHLGAADDAAAADAAARRGREGSPDAESHHRLPQHVACSVAFNNREEARILNLVVPAAASGARKTPAMGGWGGGRWADESRARRALGRRRGAGRGAYSTKAMTPMTAAMAVSTRLALSESSLTPLSLNLSATDAIHSDATTSIVENEDVRHDVQ